MKLRVYFLILFTTFIITNKNAIATTYYINANAVGSSNGLSWANAFTDLQQALSIVVFGDEIWVASGQYKPTTSSDRTVAFILKDGVNIYGGFNGTETSVLERNIASNPTTLNGDIGQIGLNTDNSHNIIRGNNITSNIIVDGFRILNGYSGSSYHGGGLKITNNLSGSILLKNCYFYSNHATNYGGAIYMAAANIIIEDCEFINNTTDNSGNGGAICNGNNNGGYSSIVIRNSKFKNNVARIGAVLYNTVRFQKVLIDRCTITNNSSPLSIIHIEDCMDGKIINSSIIGNRVYEFSSNVLYINSPSSTIQSFELINSTIANNYNTYANTIQDEIIRLEESYYKVLNSIIYGNTKYAGRQLNNAPIAANSIIEGGFVNGTNIINQNPEFINPNTIDTNNFDATLYNYMLDSNSPAVDMGINGVLSNTDTLDLNSASRIQSVAVDLGCYESSFINITNTKESPLSSKCFYNYCNQIIVIKNAPEYYGKHYFIFDAQGRCILKNIITEFSIPIELKSGLYIFEIEGLSFDKFLVD